MAQHGKLLWRVIFPDPTLILAKGYVQDPMHLVLDPPVSSYRPSELLGMTLQTCDVVPLLDRRFFSDDPFCFHHPDASDPFLLLFSFQPSDIFGGPVFSDFDASMIFFDTLKVAILNLLELVLLRPREIVHHLFVQSSLIAFHRQDIISFFVDDLCGDLLLRPDGIDGHDATSHLQHLKQSWNGSNLVRCFIHLDLP